MTDNPEHDPEHDPENHPEQPPPAGPPERTRFAEPAGVAPAEQPVEEPLEEPVDEPVDEPSEPAAEQLIEPPVEEPLEEASAEPPAEPPVEEPTAAPLDEPTAAPLDEPTAEAYAALEAPALEAPALEAPAPEAPAVEAVPVDDLPVDDLPVDAVPMDAAPDARQLAPSYPEAPPADRGTFWLPALAGLVLILAVLTGYEGWSAWSTRGQAAEEQDRREALTDARSAARAVFSYDYRHLPKDFSAGRAVTTGKFRKEYDENTKKILEDVAPRYKAVVLADVSEAGVVRTDGDRVVVLVFVNQQSTSTLMTAPKITQSRLEMTMLRHGDDWLVENIRGPL